MFKLIKTNAHLIDICAARSMSTHIPKSIPLNQIKDITQHRIEYRIFSNMLHSIFFYTQYDIRKKV